VSLKTLEGEVSDITAYNKHVQEAARYICVIKEKEQATINTLAFKNYLHRLIFDIIYNTVLWLH